ncbi:MAG: MFS transporter [Ferruginibacter sp.]
MFNRKVAFIGACVGMLLFGISLITLGTVSQALQARFNLDGIGSGTIFSILPVGILTGSLLFGPVCDRQGYKMLLLVGCICIFAGFQGIAFSYSLMVLNICIYLFGVGGGIINGATNALVADISPVNKGPNLSILGVFFGIGAIGMPLLLGLLERSYDSFQVVAAMSWLTLGTGFVFAFIKFPPPKQQQGSLNTINSKLFTPLLILIAFFLFFQSSLEAIINNWTTTYLESRHMISNTNALYALSVHMAGMIVMRLITGSVFRNASQIKILWVSLVMLAAGVILMQAGTTQLVVITGLFFSGAGLAGGFPVMLGFVGDRFSSMSGTAFSFVFSIALTGNMLINYLMGVIVNRYGVEHLTSVSYIIIAIMSVLFFFITQKLTPNNK